MRDTTTGLVGLGVFAVEDTAVQLTWHDGRPGSVVRVGDASVVVGRTGPTAVTVGGLVPSTRYDVVVDGTVATTLRTLAPPPGELLYRFATVSDTHIGERHFGILPRFREDPHVSERDAYPTRCLRAAIDEASVWGAQLLVAKGDLTWSGRPVQWETVAETLAAAPVPVHATLGNHDVVPRAVDGRDVLQRHGVVAARTVDPIDVPGLRIVLGHSADRGHRYGVVDGTQRDEIIRLVGAGSTPAFVMLHHYINPLPVRSRYPRGIEHTEGEALLTGLAAAQPATFLTFGHSHRNRRKVRHGLPLTEVGSTKDYPGVWAGYAVHEGGIRQVVRRVAEPSCLVWTERTSAVLGGFWGWWSPGRLRWRCFSWTWGAR